jgi:cytoskeletal protein RodZ
MIRAIGSAGGASVISDDPPSPETRIQIGLAITTARLNRGMTSDQLAGSLKLRESFISAIEEGSGEDFMVWAYERIHLQSIARILDLNLDLIFGSETEDGGINKNGR